MHKDQNLILVGVIYSAHGIKGNVIIRSYTDPIENILNIPIIDQNQTRIELTKISINNKKQIICKIANCEDRNQAEAMIGHKLYCRRDNLPKIDHGEFYFSDLKNIDVLDRQGNKIGFVYEVHNFGAGDLIEIEFTPKLNVHAEEKNQKSKREIYPFTEELFPEITKNHLVLAKENWF